MPRDPTVEGKHHLVNLDHTSATVELNGSAVSMIPSTTVFLCLVFFWVFDRVVGACFGGHSSSIDHSTRLLRSTALPKVGSFVPADSADMCCLDGIFTRMGAGDDLAAGMSTFMVIRPTVFSVSRNAFFLFFIRFLDKARRLQSALYR